MLKGAVQLLPNWFDRHIRCVSISPVFAPKALPTSQSIFDAAMLTHVPSDLRRCKKTWSFSCTSPAPRKSGRYRAKFKRLQIELENPSHALALLRPRRERPRRPAAKKRNEIAPLQAGHATTS